MDEERKIDLMQRFTLFLTHFCKVQKLKTTKPIGAMAEFLVSLMEEKGEEKK